MLQSLLNAVAQPVTIIQADGRVAYANDAARKRLGGDLTALTRAPALQQALRDLAAHRLVLPTRITLPVQTAAGQTTCLDGLLLEGPNQRGAILVCDPDVNAAGALPLKQVFQLIDAELRAPMAEVEAGLAARLPIPAPDGEDGTAAAAREFAARLDKLLDLVDAFAADRIVGDDRILLPELVAEVARGLEPLARSLKLSVDSVGLDESLPPIYGSRRWLARAVHECLDNAMRHARSSLPGGLAQEARLDVTARQSGPFVLLRVVNRGVGRLSALGERALLPLSDPGTAKRSGVRGEPVMRIGLPLAQRILQQHGGQVRIGPEPHDDTVVVMLELPTGAPREAMQMDIEQAQRYAADLGKLMATTRRRASAASAVKDTPA